MKNLSAFYGNIEALRAIDLWARAGRITTIIGANGAGKTTLLRAISGLIPTRYGEIRYVGQDITNLEPHRIVKMGISHVPEGRQVFATMPVRENLLLGAHVQYARGRRHEVAEDLERVFGLFPILRSRAEQLAGTLSGGEQQMLAIGRALMARPKLMMLDEPSMGLAPLVVKDIFAILRRVREAGTTVLLVEQNARSALRIADRGYVLETGRIVLQGTAEELLANRDVQRAYLGSDLDAENRAWP